MLVTNQPNEPLDHLAQLNGRIAELEQEVARLKEAAKLPKDKAEITEQPKDRHEIEQLNTRLNNLLESITSGFLAVNHDWQITYVNQEALKISIKTKDELIGKNLWEEFAPAVGTIFETALRRVAREQRTIQFEEYYPPFERWLQVTAYPGPEGVSVIFNDVSARKRGEEERLQLFRQLQESNALLDTLFNEAPIGLGFWDKNLRYVRVNDALAQINGVSAAEHIGKTVAELLPEVEENVTETFRRVAETGESVLNQEASGETPASPGQKRYWSVSYYPVRMDGEIVGVGATCEEITERRRVENNQLFLSEVSAQLATTLDYERTVQNIVNLCVPFLADWCSLDLIDETGMARRVATAHVDPAKRDLAHQLLERYPNPPDQPTDVIKSVLARQAQVFSQIGEDQLKQIARTPEHYQALKQLNIKSGMTVPLIARGKSFGAFTLAISESNRRYTPADLELAQELANRAAQALDNARLYREAQKAIAARTEFLSVAAHELKTPLTGLRGYVQLLARQLDKNGQVAPERLQRALEVLDQQSNKLGKLLTQLLDVSRIEAGKLQIEPIETNLTELVASVVNTAQTTTDNHTLSFNSSSPNIMAMVDPVRFEQVVVNLVDNAVKYSPDGGPVRVELEQMNDEPSISLLITDRGIGIPEADRKHIFERFYQAHASNYLKGLGLGLYISREIIELHGGQIKFETPAEGGTQVIVKVPVSNTGS